MGQGRSCCNSDKVPNATDISTAPQEQNSQDASDQNDDIKESSEPRILGENFDDVSLIAPSAVSRDNKSPEWLKLSESQAEMKRCASNFGLISTWVRTHMDRGEECIDSNEFEKLFAELKECENEYGKYFTKSLACMSENNKDDNWKEKIEHLDILFGKAEHCNADLERKNRLGKQTSMHMEEFERIAMDVLSMSPKDMVELKMPIILSESSSEDSDMLQDSLVDAGSSKNLSLANAWIYEAKIEENG